MQCQSAYMLYVCFIAIHLQYGPFHYYGINVSIFVSSSFFIGFVKVMGILQGRSSHKRVKS